MPIAFARLSIHTRSAGHSAVAGAAYRAGEKLLDERTGENHNFINREDINYTDILLPVDANKRYENRSFLWNEVERCEKRKDAQIAKDLILALPKEIDLEHQIRLAREFADAQFVSQGLVVDIAIHDNQKGNPHAHLYITTRRLLGDRFDLKKARDLNPEFAKGFVKTKDYWGENWRDFQNHFFKEQGIDLTVDQNQIIAQVHEGRMRGKQNHSFKDHYLKEENRLRRDACRDIVLKNSISLLDTLSERQAVFTERDIATLVFKNTQTAEQYQRVYNALKAHQDLIYLGKGTTGKACYTSRANYQLEAKLGDQVDQLVLTTGQSIKNRTIKKAIKHHQLTEEQTIALFHLATSTQISALVGRAGTGKSYLMKAANDVWQKAGLQVRGITVSGIAAKGLEQASSMPSMTIYAFKSKLAYGSLNLTNKDVIVMDEAGMTNLNDMALVVETIKATGAKLVLVGDPAQLQPIGKGAPFRAIVERIGFTELQTIMRQKNRGDRHATRLLSTGHSDRAIDYYDQQGQVHWYETPNKTINALIQDWGNQADTSATIITAFRNSDVDALNQAARNQLKSQNKLSEQGQQVQTTRGVIEITKNDRLLFLKNDRQLNVSNGEFGTVSNISNHNITVALSNKQSVTFNTNSYQDFTHGYAATVHKLQGTTKDHVFVYVGGKMWNKALTYVALSRHKETVNVYADRETHKNKRNLKRHLSRTAVKDNVLDWPISFAIRRGFDPEKLIGRFIDKIGQIKETIHDKWLYVADYERHLQRQDYQESRRENRQTKYTKKESNEMIEKILDKTININQAEWHKLKSIDDTTVQWLLTYYDKMRNQSAKKDSYQTKQRYKMMEQLIEKLASKKKTTISIEQSAPLLAKQFKQIQLKKIKEKQQEKDRDR